MPSLYFSSSSMTTVVPVQVSRKFPSRRGSVRTESKKLRTNAFSGSLLSPNGARQRKVAAPSRTGINERTIPRVHAAGLPLNRANILCFPFRNFLSVSLPRGKACLPTVKGNAARRKGCKGWIKISRYDNSRGTFTLVPFPR